MKKENKTIISRPVFVTKNWIQKTGLRNKSAFTLVELIVVITILAILATIAFISIQWFSRNARNSTRISDLKNIEKVLSLYQLKEGIFPTPTNPVDITYSWSTVWTQWLFWEDTRKQFWTQWQISNIPTDPLTWSEYTYSVLNTKNEYQVAWVFEWDYLSHNNNLLLQKTYAATWEYGTTYIRWNYNWKVAKVSTWSTDYILALPSIISWDISLTNIVEILNTKKLAYNWYHSLPSSYSWTTLFTDEIIAWNLVNTWSFIVYSWSINTLIWNMWEQVRVLDNTKQTYTLTETLLQDKFLKQIDDTNINISSPTPNDIYLATTLLNMFANIKDIKIAWVPVDCENSITDAQLNKLNTFYQEWDIYVYWSDDRDRYNPSVKNELTKSEWCNDVLRIEELWNGATVDIVPPDLISVYNSMNKLDKLWIHNKNDNIITKKDNLQQLNNLYINTTTLPIDIYSFSNLKWLYLRDNTTLTSIPPEIWNLTNLDYLWFRNNKITSITPEIWTLNKLELLELSHLNLTSIPTEIYNLTNLTELRLDFNQITTIPPELFTLTNLIWLWIWHNQLTTIPSGIWNLTKLKTLLFHENKITSIPPELWTLINLQDLYLNVNQITNIPPEIWNLINLERLQLGSNKLTNVPSELWTLTKLKALYLYSNQLTSIPPEIWNLINLERRLNLSNNQLTKLPSSIWNLTNKLQWLNLAWNSWLWQLNLDFGNTTASKTQTNITPDWKTVTIAWNWTTIGITVTNP